MQEEMIVSNAGTETPITTQSKVGASTKERKGIRKALKALKNDNKSPAEIEDFVIEQMGVQRSMQLPPHLPDASIRTESHSSSIGSINQIPKETQIIIQPEPLKEETKLALMEEGDENMREEIDDEKGNEEDYEFKEEEDIIKIENGHKTYLLGLEGVAALRGISVTIKRKEFVCIFGTSGGGKTTLLNIIGTIDKPTKGNVFVDGIRVKNSTSDKSMASLRLNKLSFVFQTFNLISTLTALENVELPMQLKGDLPRSQIKQRAKELLEKVGLGERLKHFPKQLSGGEQQRVTIARALANDPEIMLLDEPTGDLDTKNTDIVMKILMDLNKRGITLIMVSHDLNLKNYAHRVIRISDGKMIGQEIISKQARKKHYEELCERLDHPEKERLTIREGADYLNNKDAGELEKLLGERFPVKVGTTTSVRAEGDYKVVRMAMERRLAKNSK